MCILVLKNPSMDLLWIIQLTYSELSKGHEILWELGCRSNYQLTKGKGESNETLCILGLVLGFMYERCSWLHLRICVFGKRPITFIFVCGLVKCPRFYMLSLHPYGKAIPSVLIQWSSVCLWKGVFTVGLLVWCYSPF